MKKWNAAKIEEVNIKDTAYGWLGFYQDGGRFGDGQVSGHLSWTEKKPSTTPAPETETDSEETKNNDTNTLS
jgi:hypothetical protein